MKKSYSRLTRKRIEDVSHRRGSCAGWKNCRNWPEKKTYRCGYIREMKFSTAMALIEFLPGEDYSYIRDALGRVASFGYWPILAHVERYTNVINRMDKAVGLKEDTGCYFQVNAASITGEYGFTTKKVTRKLLREELVEFIATDAHRNEGKRSPKMKACAEWVEKKMGREKAEKIFRRNPEAILADQMM